MNLRFVYLFLVAQYDCWTMPIATFGAFTGINLRLMMGFWEVTQSSQRALSFIPDFTEFQGIFEIKKRLRFGTSLKRLKSLT